MADHDQRLKGLVREFLEDAPRWLVPEWAGRFDTTRPEWLDQELFPDPPRGERRVIDLVVRVPVHESLPGDPPGGPQGTVTLLHFEAESGDSAAPLRPRIKEYNDFLRFKYGLPVLSLAIFLGVGLQGIGWDRHLVWYWGRQVSVFEYPYLGLPALDAWDYVHGDNWLAVGLVGLMRCPGERRAKLKLEAMQRIATSPHSAYKRYLLMECVDAYLPLEEPHLAEYQSQLQTPKYQEARVMVQTTYERGIEDGQRNTIRRLLERRFGLLDANLLQRLKTWPRDQLPALIDAIGDDKSLAEMGLADEPSAD